MLDSSAEAGNLKAQAEEKRRGKRGRKVRRRWVGGRPLPGGMVKKLQSRRAAEEGARRERAQKLAQDRTIKFDPNDFREFVSSFRKSKLRRKTAAAEARKKAERLKVKQAAIEQREAAKKQKEQDEQERAAHRAAKAEAIPVNDPLAIPCAAGEVDDGKLKRTGHGSKSL